METCRSFHSGAPVPNYLIDSILPTSRIHLIGGNSNAGKTRFLIPMLMRWEKGEKILGYDSHPVPWAYVVGDRLKVEADDTISTMGIDPTKIDMIPAFGEHNKNWVQVMHEASKRKLGLLVWEGFGDFPMGERKKDVREFLSAVSAYCHSGEFYNDSLTILGVMESPKLKPAERYADPRQRISGIASWGYHTSSVFLIEAEDPKELENPNRVMYVSVKNSKCFKANGCFTEQGQLHFHP